MKPRGRACPQKISHGGTEITESGPDAADVDGSPASHLLKTPFEYEYEYRCAEYEYEYEEIRESEIALLSVLLRGFAPPRETSSGISSAQKCLTALPCAALTAISAIAASPREASLQFLGR